MFDFLKSIFCNPVVIPLELEEPPEWTDKDRSLADAFFNRSAGVKLRKILYYEVMSMALRPGLKDPFEQGVNQGKNSMLARILNLSEVEENTDEKA